MAVAFDATAFADINTGQGVTDSLSYSITIGGGTNRAIAISAHCAAGVTTVSSITVGGVAATLVAGTSGDSSAADAHGEIWALANPATGAQTVLVTFSNGTSTFVASGAVSVSGADQSTPCNNGTVASGGGGAASLPITSNAGDLTVDSVFCGNGATTISAPTQTQRWLDNATSNHFGGSTGPGTAGPITHAWTLTGYSTHDVITGVNFKQASGASSVLGGSL